VQWLDSKLIQTHELDFKILLQALQKHHKVKKKILTKTIKSLIFYCCINAKMLSGNKNANQNISQKFWKEGFETLSWEWLEEKFYVGKFRNCSPFLFSLVFVASASENKEGHFLIHTWIAMLPNVWAFSMMTNQSYLVHHYKMISWCHRSSM
jgi:hypothetical protein